MSGTLHTAADLIATHGYWVLFAVVGLQNAGVPMPAVVALIAAASLSHPASGAHLYLPAVIAVAALAAVVGDALGYWLGKRFARPRIEQQRRFLFLTPRRLRRAEVFFKRYGVLSVFLGRFVALFRVVAAPAAGVSDMGWRRFFVANVAGAIVWATVVGLVGYYWGGTWAALHRWLGAGAWAVAGLVGLIVVAWHFVPYLFHEEVERKAAPHYS
jgi:membrane-associated protein